MPGSPFSYKPSLLKSSQTKFPKESGTKVSSVVTMESQPLVAINVSMPEGLASLYVDVPTNTLYPSPTTPSWVSIPVAVGNTINVKRIIESQPFTWLRVSKYIPAVCNI